MEILKKVKMLGDVTKWNWKEASCDPNGKSSFMPFMGCYLILIGGAMSIYAGLTKQLELVSQYVILAGLGSTILIGRKIMNGKPAIEDIIDSSNETH